MFHLFKTVRIESGNPGHLDASGNPHPPGTCLMRVDNHQLFVDLSRVECSLIDPTITLVTWGKTQHGNDWRDGGEIARQDGTKQRFWDRELLHPLIDAWRLRRDALAAEQRAHDAKQMAERKRDPWEPNDPVLEGLQP